MSTESGTAAHPIVDNTPGENRGGMEEVGPTIRPGFGDESSIIDHIDGYTDEVTICGCFNQNTPRMIIQAALRPLVKRINEQDFEGKLHTVPYAPYLGDSCGHSKLPMN